MNIEKQVCTFEQAKRLKELGITSDGFGCWVFDTLNQRWDLGRLCKSAMDLIEQSKMLGKNYNPREYYSFFTVAELGAMLPNYYQSWYGNNAMGEMGWICSHIQDTLDVNYRVNETQSKSLAAMLIYLLENSHITAQEANERLASA